MDEKHKKYHETFQQYRGMLEDDHHKKLDGVLKPIADKFFADYQKGGIVDMGKVPDDALRKFSKDLFGAAKKFIIEDYLMLKDGGKALAGIKTKDGDSVLEQIVSGALNDMDETALFDMLRRKGQLNVRNLAEAITPVTDQHVRYRLSNLVKKKLNDVNDLTGIENYLNMVKDHNPKTMQNYRKTKFKGLQEAQETFTNTIPNIQPNYHPDQKTTYH